ncbi:MAG TPA: hypothetical protein DCS43_17195 [Verrucomicrobia bacterium]|nr:hypothetical protein [Verrucomicrobiota bacterium]
MITKDVLKKVLLDQREEAELLLQRCTVERDVEAGLRASLDDKLIKVIMGVRRSGKSVLAHRILKNKSYAAINFDDERLFNINTNELGLVLEAALELYGDVQYLLLDEIQNVAGWELFVNRLQRNGYGVIVTGSNAHLLSQELATHLTGRHRAFEVYPYSFREFLRAEQVEIPKRPIYTTKQQVQLSSLFSIYLETGGFPELKEVVNPRIYLQDLYDRAITRDIAMRHGIRHIRTFKEIAGYVAANCGSKLTYQNVAQSYNLGSIHTAKNYITYLQDAYLFFGVDSFSFKHKERVRRPRKMYGIDTGLIRAVSGNMENRGLLLENLVFVELFRRGHTVNYYADVHGKYEIDFVVGYGKPSDEITLIQVCTDLSKPQTRERELRGLVQAAKVFHDLPDEKLLVLTMDERDPQEFAGRHITCQPVWEWILEKT